MNFYDAMLTAMEGKPVFNKKWCYEKSEAEKFRIYFRRDGHLVCQHPKGIVLTDRDFHSEEWEIYEDVPVKCFEFKDIIDHLKNGGWAQRKLWAPATGIRAIHMVRNWRVDVDSRAVEVPLIFVNIMGDPINLYPEDMIANDWIKVDMNKE